MHVQVLSCKAIHSLCLVLCVVWHLFVLPASVKLVLTPQVVFVGVSTVASGFAPVTLHDLSSYSLDGSWLTAEPRNCSWLVLHPRRRGVLQSIMDFTTL